MATFAIIARTGDKSFDRFTVYALNVLDNFSNGIEYIGEICAFEHRRTNCEKFERVSCDSKKFRSETVAVFRGPGVRAIKDAKRSIFTTGLDNDESTRNCVTCASGWSLAATYASRFGSVMPSRGQRLIVQPVPILLRGSGVACFRRTNTRLVVPLVRRD